MKIRVQNGLSMGCFWHAQPPILGVSTPCFEGVDLEVSTARLRGSAFLTGMGSAARPRTAGGLRQRAGCRRAAVTADPGRCGLWSAKGSPLTGPGAAGGRPGRRTFGENTSSKTPSRWGVFGSSTPHFGGLTPGFEGVDFRPTGLGCFRGGGEVVAGSGRCGSAMLVMEGSGRSGIGGAWTG